MSFMRFNPRAPCGARPAIAGQQVVDCKFQSTCPVWGTTCLELAKTAKQLEVSIHVPRVGHDGLLAMLTLTPEAFQSTCPVWGTTLPVFHISITRSFQSTCPVWGTTGFIPKFHDGSHVSIHVPRVGHDAVNCHNFAAFASFNPRAPCGARQSSDEWQMAGYVFQSTCPVWGTTFPGASTKPHSMMFQSTCPVWGTT